MRKFGSASLVSLLCFSPVFGAPPPDESRVHGRVSALLARMTLEEKVGQMTQVTLDVVSRKSPSKGIAHVLDPRKLEAAILDHHVGSILNVPEEGAFTREHWHEVITQIQDVATKRSRLKIPIIYGIDAIHGATYTLGATLFPQSIAMAASWNPSLVKMTGEITAAEVRASGIGWNFNPVMDIGRQPLWPRFWETYGEDTHLASVMGRNYIQGLQGDDFGAPGKVAACLKHYVGYSYPLNGKDRTPAWISERTLREWFLPAFEAGIAAGAPTIMVNSSEIDGIPGHANHHLLTEVLRGELKFKGFVVSDWEDIQRLHTRDRVAATDKEAVAMAVNAGVDMSMVPNDFSFYDLLLACVKDGTVTTRRIDEAVARILKVKVELGLFERPYPDPIMKTRFALPEFVEVNRQAAREVLTLLKNEKNILPLAKSAKVLVTGPTANLLSSLNGGWTITWQGDAEDRYPKDKLTILKAIQAKIGESHVTYLPGSTFDTPLDIQQVVAAAKKHDVAVVCLGEKAYCESPGNIEDLTLDGAQLLLAEELAKTGIPVVLVLVEGRPRTIQRIADKVQAILMGYLPGLEGGPAIADVLFGDSCPSGKLPFTYPRHPNGVTPYDHKPLENFDANKFGPQFPFGFGLSYTTFAYSDLQLDKRVLARDGTLTVSVKVKNTGAVRGAEVVQLYIQDEYASVSRPVRQLKAFRKIPLDPRQEQVVSFTLTAQDLSFIGRDNKRIVEAGDFKVMVAHLETRFALN